MHRGRTEQNDLNSASRLLRLGFLPFSFFLLAAPFLPLPLHAAHKPATWVEVRSPHFTVVTDAGAKHGRDVATHFEQIRGVFKKLLPNLRVDPTVPVVIFATHNGEGLGELLPGFWKKKGERHPAGMFVPGLERNYVALRLDVNQDSDYHVVYHEYVHLLERLNFTSMPLWLAEGLADFYGSIHAAGSDIGFGYPIYGYVQLLQNNYRMNRSAILPLDRVLTANEDSPEYNNEKQTPVFYAEAWALTDYLFTAKQASEGNALPNYMELVQKGTRSLAAARQAFGDLNKLETVVENFVRDTRFQYYSMKAPFRAARSDFSTRTLSPAEANAMRGDFLVATNRPQEATPLLAEAMRLDPRLAEPHESLGILALRRGDSEEALREFDHAITLNSRNFIAYYERAELVLREHSGTGGIEQAEADLNKCINLNTNFAEGYRALASLQAILGRNLAEALALARRAIELKPGSAENHLTAGEILLHEGEPEKAAAEGRQALLAARSGFERQRAQQFLNMVTQAETTLPSSLPAVITSTTTSDRPVLHHRPAPGTPASVPPAAARRISGMTVTAQGVARRVRCRGRELEFLLMVNSTGIALHADDYSKLKLQIDGGYAPAQFAPCSALEGRHITVHFSVEHGDLAHATLTEIDLPK
jgi:tetratricopeptide (TPR) repeat protein